MPRVLLFPSSQHRIKDKEELLEGLRRLVEYDEVEFHPPSFEVDVTKLD